VLYIAPLGSGNFLSSSHCFTDIASLGLSYHTMADVAVNTPVNLSETGSSAPSSELPSSSLPSRPQHHAPDHELLMQYKTHASGSGMADSQVNAKFAFQKPGTQPPVYVAGSFSNPPWQPHQMEATQRDDGEYIFTKSWPVEEGVDIQYKYRIGDGDWWLLDESEPVADDGHGNFNNTLSTSQLTADSNDDAAYKLVPSRIEALRASDTPSGTMTPDFVKTTIEVSDSAALLHDDVPSRQVPRHVPSDTVDLSAPSDTPIEKIADTAAEVADTAAQLDKDELPVEHSGDLDNHRDDPPMLAHECMSGEDSHSESTNLPSKSPLSSPKAQLGQHDMDNLVQTEHDLDNPLLERFPSERSAIYAAVRRLSTSVDQDVVGDSLTSPRSPRASDDKTMGDGYMASPVTVEGSADANRRLKASDANHSPDRDVALRSVSSLHSIPEGDDDEKRKDTTDMDKPSISSGAEEQVHHGDGASHADDEGIAMSVPSRERKPKYTWEKQPRARRGSVTEGDATFGAEDTGPSTVAINHTHDDSPKVLVHGPDLVIDGEDGGTSSEEDNAGAVKVQGSTQRSDTRASAQSVQTVASLPSPDSTAAWLRSWLRVLFIDFFGGLFRRLFRR